MRSCRYLPFLLLLTVPLFSRAVEGKLVASGIELSSGTTWQFDIADRLLESMEVRFKIANTENSKSDTDSIMFSVGFSDNEGKTMWAFRTVRHFDPVYYEHVVMPFSVSVERYDTISNRMEAVARKDVDAPSGWMTMAVKRYPESGMMEFLAGEYTLSSVGLSPMIGEVGRVTVMSNGNVELETVNIKETEDIRRKYATEWTEAGVREYLAKSGDGREGIYEYLDSNLDVEMGRRGGDYRLAMVSNADGGYDLIYLSGASENGRNWKPGMKKGCLKQTRFVNHFDLQWVDAHLDDGMDELWATLNDGVLELHFPKERAVLRFSKTCPIR